MALTTTQVNQAFLGLLGRPATGAEAAKFAGQLDAATLAQTLLTDASFKNELSVETLSFKTVDLLNTDPAAFVESLYTALLGRASDAEGKAFWLSVAGITPNRADVVSQFIAAVQSQEGSADANAFASIQAEDKALASAWVESLYNNLAGRASDAEGLDFWTNAIVSFAMTPAQVAASFAAALALQGNTTEDGQNYLAKQGVADAFSASFKDFSTLITSNEKSAALKNLVTMMNGVNKDSQVDQYTQEVTKFSDEYQNLKAIQFTTKEDDDLGVDPETGEPNTTSGVNFTGTYNLTDETKGTIQSSDRITGNQNYETDTLTVNVIGYDKDDATKQTFNLNNNLPTNSSVEKLNINNGAATVTGSVGDDFEYINVNGTGNFTIGLANKAYKDISLNSAATKEGETGNYVTGSQTTSANSVKTGAGDDNISLTTFVDGVTKYGTINKSIDTGAGKDTVFASLGKDATANLGAGDDTYSGNLGDGAKLNAGAGDDTLYVIGADYTKKNNIPQSKVEIDGGTGTDTLDLSTGIKDGAEYTDFQGIKSIKGIEKLTVGTGTTLMASAISGQKIELSGTSMTLNAQGSTLVDLTKLTNAEGQNVDIIVRNVKTGNVNLESTQQGVNAIKEEIILTQDANKVSIKGFEKGNDLVSIEGVLNTNTSLSASGAVTIAANSLYNVDIAAKISNAKDLNAFLNLDGKTTKLNLNEKDAFYVIAHDQTAGGTNSQAKVYKAVVGNDGKVATVTTMATINVANKEVIDPTNNFKETSAETIVLPYKSTEATLDVSSNHYDGKTFVDAKKVIVTDVKSAKLTVSGDNTNLNGVDAFITESTASSGASVEKNASYTKALNVFLGGREDANGKVYFGNQDLDLSSGDNNTIASGAAATDKLYVNTTGLITIKDAGTFGNVKLDLKGAGASDIRSNIAISGDVTAASGDLTALFANATSNDKIALTLDSAVNLTTKVATLTSAAETIDASKVTALAGNTYVIATAFDGIAANDTINGLKFGTQTSGDALSITLSAAKETIDLSAAKGKNGALTITLNNFNKENDHLKLGASAGVKVSATSGEVTFTSAIDTHIKKGTISSDGVLTLVADTGQESKLTAANALSALNTAEVSGAKIAGENKWALFTDNSGKTYLLGTGASTASTDDVMIELAGITKLSVDASGIATLA